MSGRELPEPPAEAYTAKTYYRGTIASNYEIARRQTPGADRKWRSEEQTLRSVLERLPAGGSVLDAPCGTGRFASLFDECGLWSVSLDISPDMLSVYRAVSRTSTRLVQADLEHLPLANNSVDYVVSMRLLNLVPLPVARTILAEFARVCRSGAIVEVRLGRERPWDGGLRKVRRAAGGARRRMRRGSDLGHSLPGRDPVRIHPRQDFLAAAHAAGLHDVSLIDVMPNPLRLQPDNLHLAVLRRDP